MVMSSLATTNHAWLHELCRRTSKLLGWRLEFEAGEAAQREPTIPVIWQSELFRGGESLGTLRLLEHPGAQHEAPSATAVGVADLLGDLVQRLIRSQHKLELRDHDVQTLMELGRLLPKEDNLSESLQRLLTAAVELTGYWASAFFLLDAHRACLRLRASHGVERRLIAHPERLLNRPSPDRDALRNNYATVFEDSSGRRSWLPDGCQVGYCVPVQTAEGPLGSLWCYDRRQRVVTDRDLHVLQSVAAQIAATLERTVLLRESAARRRLHEELRLASKRHASGMVCPLPVDSGLEVAYRSASAAELGGDLCEVWPAGPHRTWIAVGDAVGHSITAALIMALARGALRTLLQSELAESAPTDGLLRRMNQTLCTVSRAEQFMTMVLGQVDLSRMVLTYTNAGHPQPWLSRHGRWTALQSHGLLLGVMPDVAYRRSELPLSPGDMLVFFTDGVSEAMSRDRNLFRTEGVLNAVGDAEQTSAEEAVEAIWSRLQHHMGRAKRADDQTLLVVKVRSDLPR